MPVTIDGSGSIGGGSAATLMTAQATTSGTVIDFTGIPSWVKQVTIMLIGVSTSGTSSALIQLGSTSFLTSGYSSATAGCFSSGTAGVNYTAGFGLDAGGNTLAATSVRHGSVRLINATANTWVASGVIGYSNGLFTTLLGGSVSLAGALDRIRLTTLVGTDTFDAGSVNVLYE